MTPAPTIPAQVLLSVVERYPGIRVSVIGDLMLDEYIEGRVDRLSPEAPVPVVRAQSTEYRLGGAGNVARQVAALGAEVTLIGAVGADSAGTHIRRLCEESGIDTGALVTLADRPTTRKLRVLGQSQQLLRVDWEESSPFSRRESQALVEQIRQSPPPQAIILSDYAKGLLSDEVLRSVLDQPRCPLVVVDPKRRTLNDYRGARVLTPNLKELGESVGRSLNPAHLEEVAVAASEQLQATHIDSCVVTLGDAGMLLVEANGSRTHIPALKRPVYDVTGAGDTAVAVLTLGLAAGASLLESATLANRAAGIAVGEIGAVSVSRAQLRGALSGSTCGKVLNRVEMAAQASLWRSSRRRIVFTNGCFDLLHPGHLSLLHFAKSLGDVLVLAINSDTAVRRLKGATRPVIPEHARAAMLAALECVDCVTIFDEDTPLETIRAVLPDVLVKGQDYRVQDVIGREVVEARGGRVVLAPLLPDYSTTALLARAQASG